MEKQAFFAIVGISLLVTAVSLGYSASRYISTRFYSPPLSSHRGEIVKSTGRTDIPPEKWTNIFAPESGMDIPSRFEGKVAGPAIASTSAYILLGTVSSDIRTARRAILWAEGMAEPVVARENAEVEPGVRVSEIGRDHVWLMRRGEREKLELLPVGSPTRSTTTRARPPAPAARRQTAPPREKTTINVNQIGENSFSLDESTVTELTGNINQFMTQVRIIPYFEGNESAGYRLAAMRPGSAFAQLGFRGGDIIQRVNDVELTSPEKMYTIFQNLKDEKRVSVDILRQGQKSTLTYEIR